MDSSQRWAARMSSRHEIEALQAEAVKGTYSEDEANETEGHGLDSYPSRSNTSLGMTGDRAGQSLRRKLSLGLLGGQGRISEEDRSSKQESVRRRPSRLFLQAKPRKRSIWRGGWQLVRLSGATEPLTGTIYAASRFELAITTIPEEKEDEDVVSGTSGPYPAAVTPHAIEAEPFNLDDIIGDEAERHRTPDGHKLVAIWANAGPPSKTRTISELATDAGEDTTSPAVVARFAFIGSGKAEQLGKRWALMAVMTGLAIWERERKASTRRRDAEVHACSGLTSVL